MLDDLVEEISESWTACGSKDEEDEESSGAGAALGTDAELDPPGESRANRKNRESIVRVTRPKTVFPQRFGRF